MQVSGAHAAAQHPTQPNGQVFMVHGHVCGSNRICFCFCCVLCNVILSCASTFARNPILECDCVCAVCSVLLYESESILYISMSYITVHSYVWVYKSNSCTLAFWVGHGINRFHIIHSFAGIHCTIVRI